MVSFLRCEFLMMKPDGAGRTVASARQLCAKTAQSDVQTDG
jgi:hypothetical protein